MIKQTLLDQIDFEIAKGNHPIDTLRARSMIYQALALYAADSHKLEHQYEFEFLANSLNKQIKDLKEKNYSTPEKTPFTC